MLQEYKYSNRQFLPSRHHSLAVWSLYVWYSTIPHKSMLQSANPKVT